MRCTHNKYHNPAQSSALQSFRVITLFYYSLPPRVPRRYADVSSSPAWLVSVFITCEIFLPCAQLAQHRGHKQHDSGPTGSKNKRGVGGRIRKSPYGRIRAWINWNVVAAIKLLSSWGERGRRRKAPSLPSPLSLFNGLRGNSAKRTSNSYTLTRYAPRLCRATYGVLKKQSTDYDGRS